MNLDRKEIFLGGGWVPPQTTSVIEVENPATEEVIATVPAASAADVDTAVRAARQAFPAWAATPGKQRAEYLRRLHDALAKRASEIAETVTAEVGTPMRIATRIQSGQPIAMLAAFADLAEQEPGPERIGNSLVVREAAGVVGAITPWNYPLHQVVCKLAPALAAGCTLVLKPSEIAPLSAYLLFDAVAEAGLPAGTVNLVPGVGPEAGEALARHPEVDLVSFTGAVASGARVAGLAASTIKRVTLELGGKSANVILDDADLKTAVKVGVANAFLNGGQTCNAWTRMLVPAARHDEALDLAAGFAASFVPADPVDPATKLGPLVSDRQRERVRAFIRAGIDEGARLATGGPDAPAEPTRGYYVSPTVFGDVHPDGVLAQEEIFGPVLSVIQHGGDDDAVEIANNSRYGLHGAVWSADQDRALAVARRLRTGSVDVNGGAYNMLAPAGGYKQSGVGRELGRYGLDEFCEIKSIQL
ncbi:MAG: aldehyde dehydrogenase family protein [Frankiaceae bacterium]